MAYFIERQHTCLGCGCLFRYKVDPGSTVGSLMRSHKDMVAAHPCPTCGRFQPEMVMWMKVWHTFAVTFAFVALLVLFGLAMGMSSLSHTTLAYVGVGSFAVIALIHLGTALTDPNADRDENLERAQREIDRGKLELVSVGDPERHARLPRNFTVWHVPALLLVVAGAVGFFYPICFPADVPDVPTNPELEPAIVTPGDEVSFTFRKLRVQAINGNVWRGKPTVRVLNAKELGIPETLEAEGNDRQWTTKLQVPKGSRNATLEPTIRFKIPKSAKLDGKTLRLSISMGVTYAVMRGKDWTMLSTFDDGHTMLNETLVVKLPRESALAKSREVFLVAIAGGGLSVLGGLWLSLLAWRLQWWYSSASEIVTEPTMPRYRQESSAPPVGARTIESLDRSMWGERPLRR